MSEICYYVCKIDLLNSRGAEYSLISNIIVGFALEAFDV